MSVPNDFAVVHAVYNSGSYDLKTHEGQAAFVDAVVVALHAQDRRWGHLKKNPSQTNIHGHAEDAALYLSDEPGQSIAVDFIGGAGGPDPRLAWNPDKPRYSREDWYPPSEHPPLETHSEQPAYPGDEVFDAIGVKLFADYARAGQAPNPLMGRWFGRTIFDWLAGNTATLDASIAKHEKEWRALLGLPQ